MLFKGTHTGKDNTRRAICQFADAPFRQKSGDFSVGGAETA